MVLLRLARLQGLMSGVRNWSANNRVLARAGTEPQGSCNPGFPALEPISDLRKSHFPLHTNYQRLTTLIYSCKSLADNRAALRAWFVRNTEPAEFTLLPCDVFAAELSVWGRLKLRLQPQAGCAGQCG